MANANSYVELGVPLGGLVETGLLDLGGRHEAARRSADEGLPSQSPAGSHSSNRRHGGSGECVEMGWEVGNEVMWENREHRMMFPVM